MNFFYPSQSPITSTSSSSSASAELKENKEATVSEKVQLAKPADIMSMVMKSVFRTGKTYRFRLVRTAILATSGSGTMNLATMVYPSQFVEYSSLVGMFKEARLRGSRITYTAFGTSAVVPFASAFDPTYSSGTPSFTGVLQQEGSKLWNTDRPPVRRVNSYRIKSARPWTIISASGGGTDPLSGVNGAWLTSLGAATAASTDVLCYVLEADYEFRNPQ